MSKGNYVVQVRMTPVLLELIEEAITRANEDRKDTPYDFSSWIREACRYKLAPYIRAKKRSSANRAAGEVQQNMLDDGDIFKPF